MPVAPIATPATFARPLVLLEFLARQSVLPRTQVSHITSLLCPLCISLLGRGPFLHRLKCLTPKRNDARIATGVEIISNNPNPTGKTRSKTTGEVTGTRLPAQLGLQLTSKSARDTLPLW